MVKFKADVDVKDLGVCSVSVGNNRLCPFIEVEGEGEEAYKKGCFYGGLYV